MKKIVGCLFSAVPLTTRNCVAKIVLGVVAMASFAQAQMVDLSFSGGSGTPLSITLNAPLTFTVTEIPETDGPMIVFENLINYNNLTHILGSITFTINGGSPVLPYWFRTGVAFNDVATNDFTFFNPQSPLAVGDVVVVSAGTWTTDGNFAGTAPVSGSYSVFIADGNGNQISTIPEPSAYLLMGLGTLVVLYQIRRKAAL